MRDFGCQHVYLVTYTLKTTLHGHTKEGLKLIGLEYEINQQAQQSEGEGMICPAHNIDLDERITQYGKRWHCSIPGCTVVSWNGATSTPADAETRRLRMECHRMFDPLWRGRKQFKKRVDAYRWLSLIMKTPPDKTHIGMFDEDQCRHLISTLTIQLTPSKGRAK